jgi:hypothetical protein
MVMAHRYNHVVEGSNPIAFIMLSILGYSVAKDNVISKSQLMPNMTTGAAEARDQSPFHAHQPRITDNLKCSP